MNKPAISDDDIDWDKFTEEKYAELASEDKLPLGSGSYFEYMDNFIPKTPRVLEVGCNIGGWANAWKEFRPAMRYVGIDFSKVAINIAKQRWKEDVLDPQCKFLHMNAKEMEFEDEFDVVFTHAVLQHTNYGTKEIVAPKMFRALKTGGHLVIQENIAHPGKTTFASSGWINFFAKFGFELMRFIDAGSGGGNFIFVKPKNQSQFDSKKVRQ